MSIDLDHEELALINNNLKNEYQQLSTDYSNLKKLMEDCARPIDHIAKKLLPIRSDVSVLHGSLSGINKTIFEISKNITESLLQNFIQPSKSESKNFDGLLSMVGNFLTGQRASGGNVSAGGAYLVGENGPEIFRPSASGVINRGAALTSSPINVVVNIKTQDSNSFKKSQNQLIAEVASMVQRATRNL